MNRACSILPLNYRAVSSIDIILIELIIHLYIFFYLLFMSQFLYHYDYNKINKARACMLGLAIGDALGAAEETFPNATFDETIKKVLTQRERLRKNPLINMKANPNFHLEPGDFTDDTSMALCLADSLLINQKLNLNDLIRRFVNWWDKGYNASVKILKNGKWIGYSVGLGGNTGKALKNFKKTLNPIAGGTDPNKDAGNGAIMRMAPVALYYHNDIDMAMNMAKLQAIVTHNVSESKDGCALMAYIICCAMEGKSKDEIFNSMYMINSKLENKDIIELTKIGASWRTKDEAKILTLPGRTLWSLEAALWCIYNTNNFKDAIIKSVNLGGDADTVGAIVGQMAGAIYGMNNIPALWLDTLKHKEKIEKRAIALINNEPFNDDMII